MRAPVPLQRKAPETADSARALPRALPRPPGTAPCLEARELWIAAHFAALPLEAWRSGARQGSNRASAAAAPIAIAQLEERTQPLVAVDAAAARAGARAGMSLTAAMALVPQLAVKGRDLRRERALLEHLARHAQRFTSRVSLAPPDGLLLEVKGSLKLFGGLEPLAARFEEACRAAGAQPHWALAPTALAALAGARFAALARGAAPLKVTEPARLTGTLAPLPLAVLRWPQELIERLARSGVRTIGEALRLPRAGFARRFGLDSLACLDRLVGRRFDPRASFRAPERFRVRRSLTYELEQHETVLAALTPLLANLGRFLQLRQCGISALECRLWHRQAPVTRCVLRLAAPAADPERLAALLGERLAALALPEPVRACELRSATLVPRELATETLWRPGEHGGGGRAQSTDLIERLRARLGPEAVHGLEVRATHRPEAASHRAALDETAVGAVRPTAPSPYSAWRHPLWLLPAPQILAEIDGLPRRRGPLRLLGGPERIESAWWEGEEVARDYYHAVDVRGVRLWIFRERPKPHRWFLHGVLG
ncbi:MAG TPA: DNA polymerase Y family protein [Steroidobacteraceae bacterium]|nr:DNA polymerase Y family protein [Steroidobacteraceae bacterium]